MNEKYLEEFRDCWDNSLLNVVPMTRTDIETFLNQALAAVREEERNEIAKYIERHIELHHSRGEDDMGERLWALECWIKDRTNKP